MEQNRAALAPLRGKRDESAMALWISTFGKGDKKRAEQYAESIAVLLGGPVGGDDQHHLGHLSLNTRKAYSYALTEFFEWVASRRGKIVSPEDVTRKDAIDYTDWLANRPYSLAAEKLKDGDMDEEREIYEVVKRLKTAKLTDIEKAVSEKVRTAYRLGVTGDTPYREAFNRKLRSLVIMDVLDASPTIAELRQKYPQAGITQWSIPVNLKKSVDIADVFTYEVKRYEPLSKTSISLRLSALNSMWKIFMEGEGNTDPLVKYNVWAGVQKRVNRGVASHKKAASREQKTPADLVIRMLKGAKSDSLIQLRNKAMLYLMVFAGLRTTELLGIRRSQPEDTKRWKAWFDPYTDPPGMQLLRKGDKLMRLPYPSAALRALVEFQTVLDRRAAPAGSQSEDPGKEGYVPAEHVSWYYQQLQLEDAPLFPPLAFWGRNSRISSKYRLSMTRDSLSKILKKMGEEAGLTAEEIELIHPHGIRHFSANAMVEGGKDVREVQSILGHASLTTTESYLEDINEDVRLSGQESVLTYMQSKGAFESETAPPPPSKKSAIVDTVSFDLPEEKEDEIAVSVEEVEVIQSLREDIPSHSLPISPPDFDPELVAMATDQGTVVEVDGQIIGLDGDPSVEDLDEVQSTIKDGRSPGSPEWVYAAMADPKARHETVVFNRGGEPSADWLKAHYSKMPKNFGIAIESLLPWYVKAQGNITRGGYFKGNPPFPLFSPDQVNPETTTGRKFLQGVEKEYSKFVHGDLEKGLLPSPLKSLGIVRWFGFFAYQNQKVQENFATATGTNPSWKPFESIVPVGDIRAHKDEWLLGWLTSNAHTYRASVESLRKGVKRGDSDLSDSFLKSTFEGIELLEKMPEWMVYNDPVRALYEENSTNWAEMIKWIKNVTGQSLDQTRKEDRAEQEDFALEEMKAKARNIRDILMSVSKSVDSLQRAKHIEKERAEEYRLQLRRDLVLYALVASGQRKLEKSLESLQALDTKKFNTEMAAEYTRLGIPNPNSQEYRGKEKISRIVTELFPNLPVLNDANIFAESGLFNPKWFRVDETKKTITIEASEREKLLQQFGQDPELLVRRATRAMWEAKDKNYEALWGIMLSYFSWIIPTGAEMESRVRGIPVEDLGDKKLNLEARKNWLKYFVSRVKSLASGREPQKEEEPAWQKALREMDEAEGKFDAMDRIKRVKARDDDSVNDAFDFLSSSSIDEYSMDAETMMMMAEEGNMDFYANSTRKFLPNRRGTYSVLQGEKPKGWYKVDIYGASESRYKPNAPPRFISPGAVYLSQKKLFAARQMLPSPFRMVTAIEYL